MKALAALLWLALVSAASSATAPVLHIASLEWPPYAGQRLPEQGTALQTLRQAAQAEGAEIKAHFLPWSRVLVQAGSRQSGIIGFAPEYRSRSGEQRWLFTRPIGYSPLGFAERSDRPVTWASLDDLRGKRIGVVRGYVNEENFDREVAEGRLRVEAVNDDLGNLRKLKAGRLDLVVIDARVFEYLLAATPELRQPGPVLRMNPRLLVVHSLHAAFRRDPEGQAAWELLERGLARQLPPLPEGIGAEVLPPGEGPGAPQRPRP
ncbi:MAG: ABC transporter [Silanimonas sp.]|nr:MAG: ABC transporter [Silanimonas sp.]